ncbi:MAG: fasciclin domain-containing protein, partial [Planctomycetota bacterium]
LWLSIGRKEAFTAADIARFPDWRRRIRAFHEVRPGVFEMGTEPLKALLGLSTSAETSKTPNKITSLIDSEESISVFRSALEATDLRRMLEGDGPFTVFAPTDQALSQLPNSDDLLKPEAKEQLALLLKAHIVSERIYLHGRRTESLSDLPLLLHTNGPTLVNDALVLKANMVASNGIVHVIDRVLDPDASSDASRRQMRRMIETAISFGVPLFNSGNFGECVSIYRTKDDFRIYEEGGRRRRHVCKGLDSTICSG